MGKTNYTQLADKLEKNLKKEIFEQDLAVESMIRSLVSSQVLDQKSNLKALFTFMGTPNCGKKYLLELLVKNDPGFERVKIFHMDQYSGSYALGEEQLSVISFQNELVTFVTNNPNSIIMFEDIEKADLQVQLTLYTLFTDYEKSEIDFFKHPCSNKHHQALFNPWA